MSRAGKAVWDRLNANQRADVLTVRPEWWHQRERERMRAIGRPGTLVQRTPSCALPGSAGFIAAGMAFMAGGSLSRFRPKR